MTRAHLGLGGIDFDPEPGSKAAEREAWIRTHPRQYAARLTLAAVAKVVGPLLLVWLLAQVTFAIPWPRIPWPQWEIDIPWPAIPGPRWDFEISWPSIPWPSIPLPDVTVPGWVKWVLEHQKYVVPILVAAFIARREVKRRREQDAAKRAAAPSP